MSGTTTIRRAIYPLENSENPETRHTGRDSHLILLRVIKGDSRFDDEFVTNITIEDGNLYIETHEDPEFAIGFGSEEEREMVAEFVFRVTGEEIELVPMVRGDMR